MPALVTTKLTQQQTKAIADALAKQGAQSKINSSLNGITKALQNLLNPQQEARIGEDGSSQTVTTGLNPATTRNAIMDILQKNGVEATTDQVDFTIKINTEIAQGAKNYVLSNDADAVEAYPGWELLRVYDRDVPRGMKRVGVTKENPEGHLVEDPENSWEARWRAAAAGLSDEDVIIGILETTGRMIALKSSEIWQRLGDGVGGYNDTLGNAFAPFALNSGYDTNDVSDKECVELGLLGANETAKPAAVNLASMFKEAA